MLRRITTLMVSTLAAWMGAATPVLADDVSAAAMPEPGILTLMAAGVLALALVRRLRSSAARLSRAAADQAARAGLDGESDA